MAKIPRIFQKLFAGGVPASGNVARYGSLAAGSPVYTNDPTDIQSLAAFIEGWQTATVANKSPTLQDTNALQYLMTYQLRSIFQDGVPEWNAETTYYIGGWAKHATSGMPYVSLTNDNLNNALADTNHWQTLAAYLAPSVSPENRLCKAWANLDAAGTVAINRSYNVSSFVRLATGYFRVTWSTAMASSSYSLVGSVGFAYSTPDRMAFAVSNQTASYADIQTYDVGGTYKDVGQITIQVFE